MGERMDEAWFKREGERCLAFEAMARAAMPGISKMRVSIEQAGMPYRLEMRTMVGDDGAERPPTVFTFFDDGDLRRVLLAAGRAHLRGLEQIERGAVGELARVRGELARVRAAVEVQATALAKLEGETR